MSEDLAHYADRITDAAIHEALRALSRNESEGR